MYQLSFYLAVLSLRYLVGYFWISARYEWLITLHLVLIYIKRQRDNFDKTGKILIYLINPSCYRRACCCQNGQQIVAIVPNWHEKLRIFFFHPVYNFFLFISALHFTWYVTFLMLFIKWYIKWSNLENIVNNEVRGNCNIYFM